MEIMKPQQITYNVQLEKRDTKNLSNYTSSYGTYEARDTVGIEILLKGQFIFQSWIQPTYNSMYTQQIVTLADYLLKDVYKLIC